MTKRRAEGQDIADFSGVEQLLGAHVSASETLILVNHELLACSACLGNHLLALVDGDSHGLFAQHVLARLKGSDGGGGVVGIGGAYAYGIHVGSQKLFERFVRHGTVGFRDFTGAVVVHVEHCGDLRIRICLVFGQMTNLSDLAAPDNAHANHMCLLQALKRARCVPMDPWK